MSKNIVILDGKSLGDVQYEKLEKYGKLTCYETTQYEDVSSRIKDAHIVFTNKVVLDRKNLAEAKNLEIICEIATGFNNIDIEYAKERGIAVTNVAGYSTSAVVQHTFATAFALMDEVLYYDNYVKSGNYSKCGFFTCLDKPFNEIEGKTWGIIGLGNIGKRVAKIAEAFGANVIYYSTSGKNSCDMYRRVSFDELLENSDIISIHAPLNEKTNKLINYDALCKMKKSALLINMGRGPIVSEVDLARALNEERIKGAALDVFEVEPVKADTPILTVKDKEKLILSPHIAWASVEARARLFDEVIKNIDAFYNNEERNRVDN